MAPDDTPNGPNGQNGTTDSNTPPSQTVTTPGVDPLTTDPNKLAIQDAIFIAETKGDPELAQKMIAMGGNPYALNSRGTNAYAAIPAINDAGESTNQLNPLNQGSAIIAPPPSPDAPTVPVVGADPVTPVGADPGTTLAANAPPPPAPADTVPVIAAGGVAALELAADTALLNGNLGLAVLLNDIADNRIDMAQNQAAPSLVDQEESEGIVVDGTISDAPLSTISSMDPSSFEDYTDADNLDAAPVAPVSSSFYDGDNFNAASFGQMDDFAPKPSTFGQDAFSLNTFKPGALDLGANNFNLSADTLSLTPNAFALGNDTLNLGTTTPTSGATANLGGTTVSLGADALALGANPLNLSDPLTATPTLSMAPLNLDLTTPNPLGSVAASAAAPTTVSLGSDPFGTGPDPFATTPVTPSATTTATAPATLAATTVEPPNAGPDPFATPPVTPTTVAATSTPATTDPTTISPVTAAAAPVAIAAAVAPHDGPDPFAVLAATAVTGGPAKSSFLGTTLSAYAPPANAAASVVPVTPNSMFFNPFVPAANANSIFNSGFAMGAVASVMQAASSPAASVSTVAAAPAARAPAVGMALG